MFFFNDTPTTEIYTLSLHDALPICPLLAHLQDPGPCTHPAAWLLAVKADMNDIPLHPNPAESFTLPARFYHDAEIYDKEKSAIFYRSWIYVGHQSQLAKAGDYLTAGIHEQNVFVIRNASGTLNADRKSTRLNSSHW